MEDAFISAKRNNYGSLLGFLHFRGVRDTMVLGKRLDQTGDKRTTDETRKDKVIHTKAVVAETSRKVWKP